MSAETVFADLAAQLAGDGARVTTLFGARAVMLGGRVFAILQDDRIALRLGGGTPEHSEALALPGAEPWNPEGRSQPYRDWVSVLVTENSELEDTELGELASAALRFLSRSPV